MLFALPQGNPCRTLEMLARGTGLRGDATRAPMQVRNGWRLHRRLTKPASPSKDDRFLVQTMGSTSNLGKARTQIQAWRTDYNQARPHSALAYQTPDEFAALLAHRQPQPTMMGKLS